MFSTAKFSTLFFVLCFAMAISVAFAIELPPDTIIVEAEDGEMDGGVTVVEEDDASEGKAIDSAVQAVTRYEIEIPKEGEWYVWVRLNCPDGGAGESEVSRGDGEFLDRHSGKKESINPLGVWELNDVG